jgi:hypothetical protein
MFSFLGDLAMEMLSPPCPREMHISKVRTILGWSIVEAGVPQILYPCGLALGVLEPVANLVLEASILIENECAAAEDLNAHQSSDTPILNAFWRVAPSVRFSFLAIFPALVLFRASVFRARTAVVVHARLCAAFFTMSHLQIWKRGAYNQQKLGCKAKSH